MADREKQSRLRVAVVGSGMAGLTTAYLLHRDQRRRYDVTVFESGQTFALDAASVSVCNGSKENIERVDLPMRAFAAGYYKNLIAMYKYLGVHFRAQPFVYSFEKDISNRTANAGTTEPYFVHTSNNHRLPPIRPKGMSWLQWFMEVVYVAWWYLWWSICCSVVAPLPASAHRECESLQEYIDRVRLPSYFTRYYLLPLIASVATCSHRELLDFPALDMVNYKKRSAGKQHYTVAGVFAVQKRLGEDLRAKLGATVTAVDVLPDQRVRLSWRTYNGQVEKASFDRVILAVAPDVVGKIFQRLEKAMSSIPSVTVRSMLQAVNDLTLCTSKDKPQYLKGDMLNHARAAQMIRFRTSAALGETESIHLQPSGAKVITCPFADTITHTEDILHTAHFQRALRTSTSRRVVNNIFGESTGSVDLNEKENQWRNGDDNIWLVGGWCWDGMVLLEGCIVSAMRVARDFEVEVPWKSVDV